ncbi:hypothetical protein DL98DRAFT_574827 [Cadophora sp. DSE1049]|nr:hypothetical protein DL98DRAFT_574827 [Cadophora sp. DSE1049]
MAEQTVPIKYMVKCGDPRDPNGLTGYFTFDALAPMVLCQDLPSTEPDAEYCDVLGMFICKLSRSHEPEILTSRPWRCIICKKPATGLMSGAVPFLTPAVGRQPTVVDLMAPICFVGGLCDGEANRIVRACLRTWVPETADVKDDLTFCHICGKSSGLKLCNGCNNCRYCSKECQAKDWANHKKDCKRIRLEREKAAAQSAAAEESLGQITLNGGKDAAA